MTYDPTVTNLIGYMRYIERKSNIGSGVPQAGGGNYRVHTDSPAHRMQFEWVLPYDIEGNARGASDPPGAYSSGNPKKGLF